MKKIDKKRKLFKKPRDVKILILLFAVVAGPIITIMLGLLPSVMVLGAQIEGIVYHGFQIAWTGHIRGIDSIFHCMTRSLVYWTYALGFIVDVVIWTVVAFVAMWAVSVYTKLGFKR